MAKRKRDVVDKDARATTKPFSSKKSKAANGKPKSRSSSPLDPETIQIVVGSYDQVLHGLTATISDGKAEFADTFLFNAHNSAIRCVAVSPPSVATPGQTQKVFLASGSTDERIHIYNLSAHPPSRKNQDLLAKVTPRPILENAKNREMGTLFHHASTITALRFPSRSKLLTASEDSTIAVARTRDWSVLSTIKAPVPKAHGRPSGDTAPLGATPSGVNDFAIHPSMKLMISVSKGEKCMRLWNLVTGKKAGVLSFSKDMLQEIGEGRHSTGEGRKVVWGSVDGADEFAVGFDRDVVVFGMDSVPKCRVMTGQRTKVHQFIYVSADETSLLAVATEAGQILFFSTKEEDLLPPGEVNGKKGTLPSAKLVGFVGGKAESMSGRIKDVVVLSSRVNKGILYLVGAGSEGKVRVWTLQANDLIAAAAKEKAGEEPIGKLVGTFESQNRITCLAGYVMIPRPDGVEDSEDEGEEDADDDDDEGEDETDGSEDDE
ncbi:WD40/YVTN repeat-like-containing domain protein [Metarhizium album ARSEF 1941]|uniref:WD40/YVTN repeat-like-containing domain protein n=1 Tax=Metarhizium album (strain ARSEF 1941) TaxID=1081103 RepID=A0A0B2X5D2_METAS|nr:WD40/YVTN repeat-like-containing domain protein [Metarhizium album ARSEF 1941]KHO00660.1 WD40/YVTN repeat-like-containing domain protein [Metarhizium album ARSEF 1941]